ncbi:IS3 family transposase [Oceanobacillus sp. Castelsardo]
MPLLAFGNTPIVTIPIKGKNNYNNCRYQWNLKKMTPIKYRIIF